jgi:hypothetical protein
MTKQKTPHTQTQQNTKPEQSNFEADPLTQKMKIESTLIWTVPKRVWPAPLENSRRTHRATTRNRKPLPSKALSPHELPNVPFRESRLIQHKRKVSGKKRWSMIARMRVLA